MIKKYRISLGAILFGLMLLLGFFGYRKTLIKRIFSPPLTPLSIPNSTSSENQNIPRSNELSQKLINVNGWRIDYPTRWRVAVGPYGGSDFVESSTDVLLHGDCLSDGKLYCGDIDIRFLKPDESAAKGWLDSYIKGLGWNVVASQEIILNGVSGWEIYADDHRTFSDSGENDIWHWRVIVLKTEKGFYLIMVKELIWNEKYRHYTSLGDWGLSQPILDSLRISQ